MSPASARSGSARRGSSWEAAVVNANAEAL